MCTKTTPLKKYQMPYYDDQFTPYFAPLVMQYNKKVCAQNDNIKTLIF